MALKGYAPEQASLRNYVPDDEIRVLRARREPRSLLIERENGHSLLVTIESGGDRGSGSAPEAN